MKPYPQSMYAGKPERSLSLIRLKRSRRRRRDPYSSRQPASTVVSNEACTDVRFASAANIYQVSALDAALVSSIETRIGVNLNGADLLYRCRP